MESDAQLIGQWHDFYLLAGTMAATLLGLFFVALTLRVDLRQRGDLGAVRSAAASSFGNLLNVMLISLFFLIPDQDFTALAIEISITSAIAIWIISRRWRNGFGGIASQHREVISIATYCLAIVLAWLLPTHGSGALSVLVAVIGTMLVSPARYAWAMVFLETQPGEVED